MNIENRKDKKELKYIKIVDGVQLMQELYEALPELKPREENGKLIINLRLFTKGHEIILWVPEEIDGNRVNSIVRNHEYLKTQEDEVNVDALSGTES